MIRTLLMASLMAAPAIASEPSRSPRQGSASRSSATNVVIPNSARNHQYNSGSVDQAPIGGINQNSQINYQGQNDIGFGVGIFCRTPAAYVAGFGNGTSGNSFDASNFGAVVGLNIPLGQANGNCLALSREVLVQRQLDTCLTLLRAGATFNPEVWPELERCRGLALVPPAPAPVAVPAPVPQPAQPETRKVVRGMW